MKKFLLLLLSMACLGLTGPAADSPPEIKGHPVKGVVVALMPEKTALLVKHGEVPGVMRAMTMMFKVEPAVLAGEARRRDRGPHVPPGRRLVADRRGSDHRTQGMIPKKPDSPSQTRPMHN